MINTYRTTVDERMEKEKQAVLDVLRKMPVIEMACQKTGVGTTTYYRWRRNDKEFLKESDIAFAEGKLFIIDLARTQMVSLMKDKHWPAIKYIIEHSNESLGSSSSGESYAEPEGLSPEQEQIVKIALQRVEPRKVRKMWRRKQKPKIKKLCTIKEKPKIENLPKSDLTTQIEKLPESDPTPPEPVSAIEQLEKLLIKSKLTPQQLLMIERLEKVLCDAISRGSSQSS